jgi:hypothetical protein
MIMWFKEAKAERRRGSMQRKQKEESKKRNNEQDIKNKGGSAKEKNIMEKKIERGIDHKIE